MPNAQPSPEPKHPPPFRVGHRLSEWPGCYLDISCGAGCRRKMVAPVALLLQELGDRTFADVLPKLRCRQCRAKPAPIFLCASPHRSASGGPMPDWAVEVVSAAVSAP